MPLYLFEAGNWESEVLISSVATTLLCCVSAAAQICTAEESWMGCSCCGNRVEEIVMGELNLRILRVLVAAGS